MAGFTTIISNKGAYLDITFREKNVYGHEFNYTTKTISNNLFVVEQFTNSKFPDDKILHEDDDYVIGIEGVILNLTQLKKTTNQTTIFEVIKSLYKNKYIDFVKELRGDFSGFIFSKKDNKWEVFTNPVNSKRLFYYQNSEIVIFASELRDISYLLKNMSFQVDFNVDAAYLLLTHGFMMEDITLLKDVKKLTPGTILTIENGLISTKEYFNLKNIPQTTDSPDQIIEKMDSLFANAIRLEFAKDKEYGYKHIATLSGGLDSRMTVLMAHELGYIDQLNFTFSQSNYLDELISKKIASDYKHEFMFQSLDNGSYLNAIDKVVYYNDGLIIYSGAAHVMKSIENINFDSYGLIHTGQIGDAVIGSFLSKPKVVPPSIQSGAYSTKLLHKVSPLILSVIEKYNTEELFKFYSRAFTEALNGNLYFDIYSCTASPFLDIDFLSYCYSIPPELKYKHKIYLEWIMKKHSEFGNYPWEKTGVLPSKSRNYKRCFVFSLYKRMSLKFFDLLSGKTRSGMNPIDYWLSKNKELKEEIETYYTQNIELIVNKELREDAQWLFEKGNWTDRFKVITLLAAIRLHSN